MKGLISTAMIAGLTATVIMSFLLLLSAMGMPGIRMGNMLADALHVAVWTGWLIHFATGMLLGVIYAIFSGKIAIPDAPAVKGMVFSLLPWLLMQCILLPLAGMGFLRPMPMILTGGSLVPW